MTLDKNERNWVKNGKVTLMQPPRAEDCFRLLDEGLSMQLSSQNPCRNKNPLRQAKGE